MQVPMLFQLHDDPPVDSRLHGNAGREWCDPAAFIEVVGLDFGSCKVHFYMARSRKSGSVPPEKLVSWLARLSRGTLVVCEWAHLAVPQTQKSLAQPFTAEQLQDVYKMLAGRGVTLKLAPHGHSRRMRESVSVAHPGLIADSEKSDSADAISLALFVSEFNEISLADPPRSFAKSAARVYGQKVRDASNTVLNAERTTGYRGKYFPLLLAVAAKVSKKCGRLVNKKVALSLASTLAIEDSSGLRVFTHYGQIPGFWFWKRHVLMMSPWHHRAGIGRSNLMWHAFRPWVSGYARRVHGVNLRDGNKYKKVAQMSDKEKEARTAGLKVVRNRLRDARALCIKEFERMKAGRMELTDTEATDGQNT